MATRRVGRSLLLFAVLALVTCMSAVLTSSAGAQTTTCTASTAYNPSATFTATPATAVPGTTVVLSGTGWPASSTISIAVGSTTAATTTTNASGAFSFNFTIPAGATGTITATATCGALVLGTTITIGPVVTLAPTTVPTGTLPTTGSNSTGLLVPVSLSLVALGGLLVLAARKRRPETVS
jgi:LPXTG-motif cell wall-anchored protein